METKPEHSESAASTVTPETPSPDTPPPTAPQSGSRRDHEKRFRITAPPSLDPMKDETYREVVGARYTFSMGVLRGSERSMLVEAISRAIEEFRWAEAFFLADRLDEITGRGELIETARDERESLLHQSSQQEPPEPSEESRRIASIIEEKRRRWRGCA